MIKNFQTAESSQRTLVNVARRTKFQNKETKARRECFGADVLIAIAAALEPLTKMHLFQSPMEDKRRRYHESYHRATFGLRSSRNRCLDLVSFSSRCRLESIKIKSVD